MKIACVHFANDSSKLGLIYLDVKAARQCTADGGSYVQTGTTTIYTPVPTGDIIGILPQCVPFFACVHKDPQ